MVLNVRFLAVVAFCVGLLDATTTGAETVDYDGPGPRIVNGLTTQDFPTVGALLFGGNPATASSHCTGTLIGCETFLTAAHCVEDELDPSKYTVFLQHGGMFSVTSVEMHGSYSFPVADVAVLKLGIPVSGIAPTPIDTLGGHSNGTAATIAGFGRSGGSSFDYGIKRYGAVGIAGCQFGVSNTTSICWNFTSPLGTPGENSNTCNADSGGPLFIDSGSGPVVAGITSGGNSNNCMPFDNSFDTRVSYYAPFIQAEGGPDLSNTTCGGIPQVGDPDVEVFSFEGNLSGANPEQVHSFSVDAGAMLLRVTQNGMDDGLSNFDFYVRHGTPPSTVDYDCAATGSNQFGGCELNNPAGGNWYVLIKRKSGAGLYQVTATNFGSFCSDPGNAGQSCNDENVCTSGETCQGGACLGAPVANGTVCDDGDACTQPDTCGSGVCIGQSTCGDGVIQASCEECDDGGAATGDGCDASCAVEPCFFCDQEPSECGPPSGCTNAGKSVFIVRDDADPDGDRIIWKWLKGTAPSAGFGDPLNDDGFDLCVWEGGNLVASAGVAAGGSCGSRPCWRALGAMVAPSGYKFKDKSANGDGVVQVLLKEGSGSGKILWKGRGANLSLPGSATPSQYFSGAGLSVQAVRQDGGACWQSDFTSSDFQTNLTDRFKSVR